MAWATKMILNYDWRKTVEFCCCCCLFFYWWLLLTRFERYAIRFRSSGPSMNMNPSNRFLGAYWMIISSVFMYIKMYSSRSICISLSLTNDVTRTTYSIDLMAVLIILRSFGQLNSRTMKQCVKKHIFGESISTNQPNNEQWTPNRQQLLIDHFHFYVETLHFSIN